MVIPSVYTDVVANICQSEMPYTWQGNTYTQGGAYGDTLRAYNGCDSILTLTLNVMPEYNLYDSRVVMNGDLPMAYRDTVFGTDTQVGKHTFIFNRQTEFGCDSVTTLTLEVRDTALAVANINDFVLDIYPNPVQRDGEVIISGSFTEQEMDGVVIEVYNSAGERVKYIRPEAIPTKVSGFDSSGVYVVRITTTSGRVVYGKIGRAHV